MKELFDAIYAGNLDQIKILFHDNIDVSPNTKHQKHGFNALMYAIFCGQEEIVEYFVTHKDTDLFAVDNKGRTALMYAAISASISVLGILLKNRANPAQVDEHGSNVLFYIINGDASESDKVDRLSMLLDAGADPLQENIQGFTPLTFLIANEYHELFNCMLSAYTIDVNKPSKLMFTPLMYAAKKKSTHMVRSLLAKGAWVNVQADNGITVLKLAVNNGDQEMVSVLLDAGADPLFIMQDGKTALQNSLYHCDLPNIIQMLNKAGKNGIITMLCTFNEYFEKNNSPLIRDLLNEIIKSVGCDEDGNSFLHYSAEKGYANLIPILSKSIDINARNNRNCTPLHFAAASNHRRVLDKLCAAGGDCDAEDSMGRTPLALAHVNESNDAVKYLCAIIYPTPKTTSTTVMDCYKGLEEDIKSLIEVPELFPTISLIT